MSWENRDYNREGSGNSGAGRPGGDWQGIRPSFDNPMSWSLGIGRYFGIDVRLHVILLIYLIFELIEAATPPEVGETSFGFFFTAVSLGGLFLIVLLHEFGHCLACRSTGGAADEVLLWPLGGLAYCVPPHRWTAHLWTVVGGPLVNVLLIPVLAIPIGFLTGYWWGVAIPIPMYWRQEWLAVEGSDLVITLVLVAKMNVGLLLFNCLPMFPMDGGRILQSLLWPRHGYVRSMRFSLRVGYVGAICLGVAGAVMKEWLMVALAIFGGITCYNTHRQLQFTEETMGFAYDEHALKLGREADAEQVRGPSKRELKRAKKEAEQAERDSRELDRLLEKIKREGMASLSSREQRWLRDHSNRRKQGA